jgi:alkylated DNA repair dioxygenase AlkB
MSASVPSPARWALHTAQSSLFDTATALPPGLRFEAAFLDHGAEAELVRVAAGLPLHEARYKAYTARRRVHAWGARSDDDEHKPRLPLATLPPPLAELRVRLARWAGVAPDDFIQVMVAEYRPGTPLGWHRDAPHYGLIVGVSLAGPAELRLRPWPPRPLRESEVLALHLAPRSAYLLRDAARWGWQHAVPPVRTLRYSVTLRTARTAGTGAAGASGGEQERCALHLP